jgi:hypothetical protein
MVKLLYDKNDSGRVMFSGARLQANQYAAGVR